MGSKVISGNGAYRDSHPALYEGNHWDYYLSLLPIFMLLTFFAIPNTYTWRDPILNLKILNPLLKVY